MDEIQKDRLDRCAAHWRATVGRVLDLPNGIVAFAGRDNEDVVLKLPNADTEEVESHLVLQHYDGKGAVRLIDYQDGALLLERLRPGRSLSELALGGKDDEATAIICDVIDQLLVRPPPSHSFPTIEDWGQSFGHYRRSGNTLIPDALLDPAAELFVELAATQGALCLLHGDLHHENILYDQRRGWTAIDPKGVFGEPAYELGAALRNPIQDPTMLAAPSLIERRVALYSERLQLDRGRVVGWAFAQVVLSLIWSIESNDKYGFLKTWLGVAEAMKAFTDREEVI